ncbi:hypothetical protein CSC41_2604 [Pseudomonas aeruginosa]|nr:hypothetical protein CSC41_2604 [Pseudomonas aeruginosa]
MPIHPEPLMVIAVLRQCVICTAAPPLSLNRSTPPSTAWY